MINFILQNYGHFIVNALVQTSLVLTVFLLLAITIFKNNHVARFNFLLAGCMLIILCPLISNHFSFSILNVAFHAKPMKNFGSEVMMTEPDSDLTLNQNDTTKSTLTGNLEPYDPTSQGKLATTIDKTTFSKESPADINIQKHKTFTMPEIIFIIWFSGVLLLAVYVFIGFIRLKRLIINSPPLLNPEILNSFEKAKQCLKINGQPQILISNEIGSPFVTGIINPKIIIPHFLLENYNEDSFKSIVLHELAHIKRNDITSGYLQLFLQNILWFHPLIFIYNKEMNFSREEICDNYSLTHHQPKCYATILTQLAEAQLNSNNFNGVNSMITSKKDLFNRVKNILNPKRSVTTKMSRNELLSITLIFTLSILTIGSFQLLKSEDKNLGKSDVKYSDNFLDQKITIDFSNTKSLQEMIKLLNTKTYIKFSIHESISKLPIKNEKWSFLVANNMSLMDILAWMNTILEINYTIIDKEVIFCDPNFKYEIDKNYYMETFSLEGILGKPESKISENQNENKSTINSQHIKELIMDNIGRDSWDDTKGRTIQCLGNQLIIVHNKSTLNEIKTLLKDLEESAKETNDPNFIPTFELPMTVSEKSIHSKLQIKITIEFKNKSIKEILEKLSNDNNLSFSLILDSKDTYEKITNNNNDFLFESIAIKDALQIIVSSYGLDYQIVNGVICIAPETYFDKQLTLARYNTKVICKKEGVTADDIKSVIIYNLNRNSWDPEKGTFIVTSEGQLLIIQNRKMHLLISEFLKGLLSGKVDLKLPNK